MVLSMLQAADDPLQVLIGQIYDAAIDPANWSTLMAHIAQVSGGSALIYQQDPMATGARVCAAANIDPAAQAPYETYYSRLRPWRENLAHVRVGEVVAISEWITEPAYRKCEYYNDCLVPLDLYYHLSTVLHREDRFNTTIALVRPQRAGDFTAEERRLGERLAPHLRRALQMNRQLQAATLQRQAMLRGFERLSIGVVLAARDGRVLFANPVAEAVLGRGDGLRAQQQRLCAQTPALSHELHRRIRGAADTGAGTGEQAGGVLSLPCRHGGKVSLLICPFPVEAGSVMGPTVPAALVFIAGADETAVVRPSDLRQIYGLTAAEAKLVGALLAGTSLRDYAAARGLSVETAKTQLRQVFAKTGQRRQADLMRHILSNPIVQLAPRELPSEA